jgi:hypothetical protein
MQSKSQRNGSSLNPKKNPSMRRRRNRGQDTSRLPQVVIGTYALKPKRTALGAIIPGRFVRFWGGRKPSKYDPSELAKKLASQKQNAPA